jgi:hypothetical protein
VSGCIKNPSGVFMLVLVSNIVKLYLKTHHRLGKCIKKFFLKEKEKVTRCQIGSK